MELQIRKILKEKANIGNSIGLNDDLYSAGLSSFATVQVMLGIEEEFDVEFPDNALNRKTFQSITNLMQLVSELKETSTI